MNRFFRLVVILLLGSVLAGCGFHLRGSGPITAQNLYLEGLRGNEGFQMEFDRTVAMAGGRSVSSATQATGVIHVYTLLNQRRALTLGRFGRANEFDLIYRLVFDVRSPKGEVISPKQEIELHRDYYNDQSLPLALKEEEGLIRREMLKEIAQALVRRANSAVHSYTAPKS